MSKKKQQPFSIHDSVSYDDRPHESYNTVIEPSDPNLLYGKIEGAINRSSASELQDLLTGYFIYPGNGFIDPPSPIVPFSYQNLHLDYDRDPYKSVYRGGHHVRTMTLRYYDTRPVLEALFLEHNQIFQKIVSLVANAKEPSIHAAFVASFKARGIDEIPEDILKPWDATTQQNIKDGVEKIDAYGKVLTDKGIKRGEKATELSSQLLKQLEEDLPYATTVDDTTKVKWLDFKFSFLKNLHQHDALFHHHRDGGFKMIATNVASFIFSGFIFNAINYATTGDFFFFKRPKTFDLITKADVPVRHKLLAGG